MTIPYLIGGSRVVIPGVYATLEVQNSLPAPVPAGRSVLILGEGEEGIPGSELDLRQNFFESFEDVKDFYKSGSIVDAARKIFTNQPSPVFAGTVDRLYVYKTNNSARAERSITDFGDIVAARYGESGNLIKTQITNSQTEVLPSLSFSYIPSPDAQTIKVLDNGAEEEVSLTAGQKASDLAGLLTNATGGSDRTDLTLASDIELTASGSSLTLSITSGGQFGTDIAAGDSVYIAAGSDLAGASDENAGGYIVESVTSSSLVIRRVKNYNSSGDLASWVDFDLTAVSTATVGSLVINGPISLSSSASLSGSGASLEILKSDASIGALQLLWSDSSFVNPLASSTSSIASVSAAPLSTDSTSLKIDLSIGSWSISPKAGDLVEIKADSSLAGSTKKNVGAFAVTASSSQSITLKSLSGLDVESVASTELGGKNDVFKYAPGFVSSELRGIKTNSSSERKVQVSASNQTTGESLPSNSIGGEVVLEIGYYDAASTAASLSINSQRQLTISQTGGTASDLVVNLKKYNSLSELVSFLNTQAGVSAKVAQPKHNSLSPSVLDEVSNLGCLSGSSQSAYNGRIKKDYSDFVQFFENNFGLVALREGATSKSGLPAAESSASFLSGGSLGSTSQASIQSGLDAGLKVEVRQVVPLFSRDAAEDVIDDLTDPLSSYSIDAVHAATRAHVATASSTELQKFRFGVLSFDGSFDDAQEKAAIMSSERCQMTFQRHVSLDGDGNAKTFLPWMGACAVAAGRSQATLGTSMLNKPFDLSSVEHYGKSSIFTDSLVLDFDPEDNNQLSAAIEAGLLVFKEEPGFGIAIVSPDLTTRSRDNDPKAWVYERASVLFVMDEVNDTIRRVLRNFIGNRQSDTSPSVIQGAVNDTLRVFVANGSALAAVCNKVERIGVQYKATYEVRPVEALEAIEAQAIASRDL